MKLAALSALFAVALAHAAAAAENSFAVRNVRLFDGDEVRTNETVVVQQGRIVQVAEQASIPAGVPVIDGRGKTLLPGLIDSHVHVFPGAQRDALRYGVTTELDMFHQGPELPQWRAARAQLAPTSQADTWSAGIGATAPGGHPSEFGPPGSFPTISSASEADSFVSAQVAAGSDYIKIFIEDLSEFPGAKPMPTLTREEVCALVQAAHAHGKLAIVHAEAEAAAAEAVDCGADGLAHVFVDRPADPATVAKIKSHGVFVISTADVMAGQSGYFYARLLSRDPRAADDLSPKERRILLSPSGRIMPQFFPNALDTIRALHADGVRILAGTDASNPGAPHGLALHEELQILVQGGLTPVEALHSATALPADIFHLGKRGRVKPGYRADLLLVDGDPTADISKTLSIARIWKNGFAIGRSPGPPHARPSKLRAVDQAKPSA